MKTWHEASTSGYCSRELKRNSKVDLVTRPLSLSVCAVINCQTDLGDVTETNRTQAPKQQTAGS